MTTEQRYAFEDIHYALLCVKYTVIDIIGATPLLITVSYLQLTGRSGRSARNFAALVFRPEGNHTDMNN